MIVNTNYLKTMHEPAHVYFNVLDWPDDYDRDLPIEDIDFDKLNADFKQINGMCGL